MVSMRNSNVVGALALALVDHINAAARAAVQMPLPSGACTKAVLPAAERGPAEAALMLVAHLPGMSIDALRSGVSLSHPGAVRLVDRLEATGQIVRRASAADGRRVALHLTAEGEAAVARISQARLKAVADALACLPAAEQAHFAQTCAALLAGLVAGPRDALRVCRLCDGQVCDKCPVDACLESAAAG
jgi:MarR family transcriptional regulator, negative regulator of the multidrug operon emrRAB